MSKSLCALFITATLLLAVFPAAASAQFSIGGNLSTLGFGFQAADQLIERLDIRGGINGYSYTTAFNNDGLPYTGNLRLLSVSADADVYVWGPFHLSPGLLVYDGNGGSASGSVPGGQAFTLGSVTYTSDPADPVKATGKLNVNRVAPELMAGVGYLVPRGHRHFSVNLDLGVIYQGSPSTVLSLTGSACVPAPATLIAECVNAATNSTVQSNITAQEKKLNNDFSVLQWYPVATLSIAYKF